MEEKEMENTFCYEMHLHTCACSACAAATGQELVEAAKERGYAGIVITNHFYHGNSAIDRSLPWSEFVGAYAKDYEETKAFAEKLDLDVFFGVEEAYDAGKEVLIYGLSPRVIAETPAFREMTIAQISDFVHDHHGFLAYAHPFRSRSYIPDPYIEPDLRYVDAIETYNAHNEEEANQMAEAFAQKNGVSMIAGGDVHDTASIGLSGLLFSRRLYTPENLVRELFAGRYRLFTGEAKTQNENL